MALDDFGTGFSSLSHLASLPVQVVKVDRSFVSGMDEDDTRAAVVAGVVQLAQALGLQTVAEGIETRSQQQALAAAACGLGQGYLFARPLDAEVVEHLLQRTALAAS